MALDVSGASHHDRLGDLYLRHAPDGIRLAYLLTGDRTLAEDLTHEAFARAIGRLVHIRDPEAFGAYLRRAVINLSKNHFRHASVERAFLKSGLGAGRMETVEPDVSARDALRRALLSLPERQRAAIVLRFYEDLSETAVAEILRCRPGTVRSLVSRGMQSLRASFRGSEDAR